LLEPLSKLNDFVIEVFLVDFFTFLETDFVLLLLAEDHFICHDCSLFLHIRDDNPEVRHFKIRIVT
jgi:hypothetical protein